MSFKHADPAAASLSTTESQGAIELRRFSSLADYQACVALQQQTWGEEFSELVPVSILKISQRIGGVAAGAFDEQGELLGFVFGISGLENGRLVHWSDMLAVRREARGRGIGQRLKHFQRALLLELGVERVYWTFDPLVARNAHLNLNRLGARVQEYVSDMYGYTESRLHRGLGTDRFIVAWQIAGDGAASDGQALGDGDAPSARAGASPLVNQFPGADGGSPASGSAAPDDAVVRVAIPSDIERVQRTSLAEAAEWRASTRAAFETYLGRGYRVSGFHRDPAAELSFYLLSRHPAEEQ